MFTVIAVIHVLLCLMLMGLVLLQQGKGADAGAVLGGGGDSLLAVGGAGAAVTKITTGLAVAFMVTSIVLVKLYDQGVNAPVVAEDSNLLKGSIMEPEVAVENEAAVKEGAEKTDVDLKAPEVAKDTAAEPAKEVQAVDAKQPEEKPEEKTVK